MKNLTTIEKDLIAIIIDCISANTGISSHKEYPGITLSDIKDEHICNLTISTDSRQFFNRLADEIEYEATERPAGLSIFLTEYCDNLCWHSLGSVVNVCVSNIYINFKSIEKLMLKLKQCGTYGFTLDAEKLIDEIYANIISGVYDLNEDEYI